ncbi:trypsin-like peptidase domain-containing protein [Candidatus Roizmanbacteria bacterium]|nr:trypsin-like peptidase domain-containing protein [Candidatus Roizmanbacteria bacterium]
MKRNFILIALIVILLAVGISSGYFGFNWQTLNNQIREKTGETVERIEKLPSGETVRVVNEESVVIDVVEKVNPSVVTVGVERQRSVMEFDPRDPFGFFQQPRQRSSETEKADIGSGFILSADGLIVTNKHVVSQSGVKYSVITSDNKTYEVKNIYRDPANDVAIVKIDASGLKTVELGNSDQIKVGQMVIAMGTPLGEFRGTVTKGIVSGLGRGITAGSPLEGFAEELDNVIQTDAAINPGNSGGPLLNSSGQVIGVNTAVASGAENIGFALPINLVKEALDNFKVTGSFDRAFLGVSYSMLSRDTALLNEVPEGAYVREVVEGSAAEKAGIQQGDIITYFDGQRIKADDGLATLINKKKIGDRVTVKIWRDEEEKDLTVTMGKYDGS